jgi:hypothetical protein
VVSSVVSRLGRVRDPETLSYCSNSTKCSGDGDPQFFLMCSKNAIIQKKFCRPSRGQEILKIVNTWSDYYSNGMVGAQWALIHFFDPV